MAAFIGFGLYCCFCPVLRYFSKNPDIRPVAFAEKGLPERKIPQGSPSRRRPGAGLAAAPPGPAELFPARHYLQADGAMSSGPAGFFLPAIICRQTEPCRPPHFSAFSLCPAGGVTPTAPGLPAGRRAFPLSCASRHFFAAGPAPCKAPGSPRS